MTHAIGWSDCEILSRKMGELHPKLLRYVVGRSGDDYMLRVELLDIKELIQGILKRSERAEPQKASLFPESWCTGPVPGNTYVLIQTQEDFHVARFVGQPGHWDVAGIELVDQVLAWRHI